ncbi:NapC/NirT family cytochrome c [Shigella flexneri]
MSGVIFWGASTGYGNCQTEEFELAAMKCVNSSQEYMDTIHYTNRSGVRATCPDRHVPHESGPKMVRKIQASKEVYRKIFGIIDTPQKFEDHR